MQRSFIIDVCHVPEYASAIAKMQEYLQKENYHRPFISRNILFLILQYSFQIFVLKIIPSETSGKVEIKPGRSFTIQKLLSKLADLTG